jgi:gliding motility-associated-like protein
VPNALSPEFGVGEVRVFHPKGVGLDSYSVQIFNTWGELLWQSTALVDGSPTESWDGTFNGEVVPQDVYVWKIEATFLDGTVWQGKEYGEGNFKRIGTVTVIR